MNPTTDNNVSTLQPLSARTRRRMATGALAAASAVFALVVMPAEFGIDPTGFGRLTGLSRLHGTRPLGTSSASGPALAAKPQALPYRCNEIDIPLAAGGDAARRDELEYKLRLTAGDGFVYAWKVPGVANSEEFYFDFHGETPATKAGEKAVVIEYQQATGTRASGMLTAPIDGVHGWFLQNQSAKPVVVELKVCGFYALIEAGAYGNNSGIQPRPSPQQ